jgi:integrase
LHGGDFRKFHDAVMSFNEVFRDAYLVCLYSGLRSSEASSIRWDYVDMGNATLLIPTTKSGEPLHVPLSTQTVKILQHRQSANTGKSPYVFPAQSEFNKGGHVILKSGFLQLKTGLKITVHGLRRSFVDVADNKLKHRRQDVDRLTNHVDSTVTGRHYSHKDVEDLRPVIQAICDKLEHLLLNGAVD